MCKICAIRQARERKRRADKKYRITERGLINRRNQSQRQYTRRCAKKAELTSSQWHPETSKEFAEVQPIPNQEFPSKQVWGWHAALKIAGFILYLGTIQGDHGSPFIPLQIMPVLLAIELAEGASNETSVRNQSVEEGVFKHKREVDSAIFCEFCGERCAQFSRRLGRWRTDKRIWEKYQQARAGPESKGGLVG